MIKGSRHSQHSRELLSRTLVRRNTDPSYQAIHKWVRRHKHKTGRCEWCRRRRFTEFANISGTHERDVNSYIELCRPCHRILDGNSNKAIGETE